MVPAADVVLRKATARDTDSAYQTRRAALAPYVAQDGGWDEVEEQRVHARRFAAHEYRVSRPGESHPRALAEPYMNVSAHTAPIIQPPASRQEVANERTGSTRDL